MTESRTETETDVVTRLSPRSVGDTVARLTGLIARRGMKLTDALMGPAGP